MMYETRYRIKAVSAISFDHCILGEGKTEASAWEDALGEKPWSSYQKKLKKKYWVERVVAEMPDPIVYRGEPDPIKSMECKANSDEYEEQNDYVGMGWVGGDGRP